jgi:hypothetical protein
MAPDTKQNLFYTISFLLLHNAEAIFYLSAVILFTLLALYKPTRGKVITMWGFLILLFAFEYNKHILEPLTLQFMNSLITERPSFRIEYTINLILVKLVPTGLPIIGWCLVVLGFFFDKILKYIKIRFLDRKTLN